MVPLEARRLCYTCSLILVVLIALDLQCQWCLAHGASCHLYEFDTGEGSAETRDVDGYGRGGETVRFCPCNVDCSCIFDSSITTAGPQLFCSLFLGHSRTSIIIDLTLPFWADTLGRGAFDEARTWQHQTRRRKRPLHLLK